MSIKYIPERSTGPTILLDGQLSSASATVTQTVAAGTYLVDSTYRMTTAVGGTSVTTNATTPATLTVASTENSVALTNLSLGDRWLPGVLPADGDWTAIAYGNGVFATLASSSTMAATSTDGITWTTRSTATSLPNWRHMTFGNGLFVAVADGTATGMTSANGISWTTRTMPSASSWIRVVYGGTTFLAVNGSGTATATSTNGTTWTARALPSGSYGSSLAYGGGVFAVLRNSSGNALTSPDGITWTSRTMPAGVTWDLIAYGNSTFVAMGIGGPYCATSPTGTTWTLRTKPLSYVNNIEFGGGYFLTTQPYSSMGAMSADGITWRTVEFGLLPDLAGIAYGNNTFVITSSAQTLAFASSFATTPFSITAVPTTIY